MELDEALDRLYAAPLNEFTATRNELAKTAGTVGAHVRSLKKPNLAAWALNQLSRRHGDELSELYAATERLRLAQRRVLSGGKATALREASDARSRIVGNLTKRAAAILTDGGHVAAATTLAAVGGSLIAIASDEEGAELLRTGRLTRELRAESVMSVEHGAGLTLVDGNVVDAGGDDDTPDGGEAQAARSAVNEARDRAQAAKKAVKEAEAEVSRRTSAADEAERAAKAAREATEFARRAVEARKAESDDADRALERAQEALDKLDS